MLSKQSRLLIWLTFCTARTAALKVMHSVAGAIYGRHLPLSPSRAATQESSKRGSDQKQVRGKDAKWDIQSINNVQFHLAQKLKRWKVASYAERTKNGVRVQSVTCIQKEELMSQSKSTRDTVEAEIWNNTAWFHLIRLDRTKLDPAKHLSTGPEISAPRKEKQPQTLSETKHSHSVIL